jgi:single-strand DNA-binding protein
MAFTFNRVELIGRVGATPDVSFRLEGDTVARLSVATDRASASGSETQAEWHHVVCFGRLGQFAGQHVTKGRLVFVAGRLSYRNSEGRDGGSRRRAEILASELILLDRRPSASADSEPSVLPDADDIRA